MSDFFTDEYFMKQALQQAKIAFDKGEVPIGAVVVFQDRVISKAHNLTETLQDPTAHAEMLAITSATNMIGGKFLKDCVLYVTVEPCVMCAGASYWSQIGRIIFGTSDNKRGYSSFGKDILHPKTTILGRIMQNECEQIMKEFFLLKR